jgi:FAD/FMN-containing dehydrogenase
MQSDNRDVKNVRSDSKHNAAKGEIALAEIRRAVRGQVIVPGDAAYEESCTVFYGGIDKKPRLVIRPVDAADVAHTVSLARENGLELAVRSGGHSSAGHSLSDGGVVLDLRDMKALHIDPASRTAWAQTGLTAGEYTAAADAYDLATGFGDAASVGIGGITLGGGIGYLVRKHGLTIDSLLAAEVVTADGQVLQVDAETHPDLFWAMRGGGGNFGVATRFQFRLHELGTIMGGMLFLPATPQTIAGFIADAEAAPEELSTIANIMPAPPMPFIPEELYGKMIIFGMMVYAGDSQAGERVVAPFRALAKPLADMLRPMRYPEMYMPEEEGNRPTAAAQTLFLDRVDHGTAQTIIQYLQDSDAGMRVAQLRVLGGAMSRVPVEATAFAHRHSRIMASVAAFYEGPEDRLARQAWVEGFAKALQQSDRGAYVNFLGDEGAERVRSAYPGATWDRLRQVKQRYDPTNLFRLNQNIPPAEQA